MANFEQIEQNKFGIKNNTFIFTSPVPEEVGEISIINFGEKFHLSYVYPNHSIYLNLKHFPPTPFITNTFLRKIIKK